MMVRQNQPSVINLADPAVWRRLAGADEVTSDGTREPSRVTGDVHRQPSESDGAERKKEAAGPGASESGGTSCAPTPGEKEVPMMTISDIAAALNVSRRTVFRLLATGRIPPPVRLGKIPRWPADHFQEWIAAGCPAPSRLAFPRGRRRA